MFSNHQLCKCTFRVNDLIFTEVIHLRLMHNDSKTGKLGDSQKASVAFQFLAYAYCLW